MKNSFNVNLYAMYDRKSNQYAQPFIQTNHKTAVRFFNYQCGLEVNKMVASDLELYFLGTYNLETGVIVSKEKPEFLVNVGDEVDYEE